VHALARDSKLHAAAAAKGTPGSPFVPLALHYRMPASC
jgi:hypothetical protein